MKGEYIFVRVFYKHLSFSFSLSFLRYLCLRLGVMFPRWRHIVLCQCCHDFQHLMQRLSCYREIEPQLLSDLYTLGWNTLLEVLQKSNLNLHCFSFYFSDEVPFYFTDMGQMNQLPASSSNVPVIFPCPNGCGRQYKYKGNLTAHLKLECGKEKQFKCSYCHKTFAHKSHVKKHTIVIHRMVWKWI